MKQTPQENPKLFLKRLLIGFLSCIVLIAIYKSVFPSDKKQNQEIAEEKTEEKEGLSRKDSLNRKLHALTFSEMCVDEKLKAPATSEYPVSTDAVVMMNDSTFVINSYVDSQNSFGALIRTKFVCKLTVIDKDNYRCDNVVLYE